MFRVTFLGHQGSVVEPGSATLLVDPLLAEDFGHSLRARFSVYPRDPWTRPACLGSTAY